MHVDYAILGNGLFGSALAYYLSKEGYNVIVCGTKYGQNNKYFSSHEDSSRMYRVFDDDDYWSKHAEKSIREIRNLEKEVGISLFREMPVYYNNMTNDMYEKSSNSIIKVNVKLSIPSKHVFFRDILGGVINPKILISSLNKIATKFHCQFYWGISHTEKTSNNGRHMVYCEKNQFIADNVFDTRGMYNALNYDDINIIGKVVYFADVQYMFDDDYCFIDEFKHPVFKDVYAFISKKHNKRVSQIKFGLTECLPIELHTMEQITDWFTGEYKQNYYNADAIDLLKQRYNIKAISVSKPCAFTVSKTNRPCIRQHKNITYFSGCNGKAAKSSLSIVKNYLLKRSILCQLV